jgi:hypothetical protein
MATAWGAILVVKALLVLVDRLLWLGLQLLLLLLRVWWARTPLGLLVGDGIGMVSLVLISMRKEALSMERL